MQTQTRRSRRGRVWRAMGACLIGAVPAAIPGCGTDGPVLGGIAGGTAILGQAPGQEIEQVYYLGMFDPLEQVPPSVYRITVRGQASAISMTKFASGWVPAVMCDTLNTSIGFDGTGKLQVRDASADGDGRAEDDGSESGGGNQKPATPASSSGAAASTGTSSGAGSVAAAQAPEKRAAASEAGQTDQTRGLKLGRRMVLFGPEGFMEAPRDHRLVIVMGSDPSKFFEAVGTGLQEVVDVRRESELSAATKDISAEYMRVSRDYERGLELKAETAVLREGLNKGFGRGEN